MNETRKAGMQAAQADAEDFNPSRLEASLYIGASALTTLAVLVWVARTYITAVF